jgi:hypothetical protein
MIEKTGRDSGTWRMQMQNEQVRLKPRQKRDQSINQSKSDGSWVLLYHSNQQEQMRM